MIKCTRCKNEIEGKPTYKNAKVLCKWCYNRGNSKPATHEDYMEWLKIPVKAAQC